MSYDLYLKDKDTGETIHLENEHHLGGGTQAIGGTTEAWLNITYNYSGIFTKVLGEKGIRSIYGLTGVESMPILAKAIAQLGNDIDEDYWKPTEGNVKAALVNLIVLACFAPHGIWSGD